MFDCTQNLVHPFGGSSDMHRVISSGKFLLSRESIWRAAKVVTDSGPRPSPEWIRRYVQSGRACAPRRAADSAAQTAATSPARRANYVAAIDIASECAHAAIDREINASDEAGLVGCEE
ncbi:hypothetical protein CS8_041840 [Cupriavidus sp. 8B]